MRSKKSASILEAVNYEIDKRKAENSLIEFMKQAWDVIEPGTEYVDGWHLHAICDHLQAVSDGKIRNLIINMPPRHCKSILVAVMWPVWTWIRHPEFRWLYASYSGNLSMRDSLKCRRLIQSTWFQDRWGKEFTLIGDQNTKTFYENDKYGYRFATSVGGTTTGMGGSAIVVDDPHSAMEAQSDVIREGVLEWWDQAMSTRLNNPKTGAKVIVMQRLHERDLTGHLLKQGGYEHLCLPAEWDGVSRKTSLGNYDPRKVKGELLWPELYDAKALDPIKVALGDYGTAGQLQQSPSPAGGGIIKVDHIKLWPAKEPVPPIQYIIQSYDTAFTEKNTGDPSACTVWGVVNKHGQNVALLLDSWAEHLGYPDLRSRMIEEYQERYAGSEEDLGNPARRPDLVLIEQKASGQSLIQDLRQANIPVRGYNPGKADKVTRAHMIAPLIDIGVVYVMESAKNKGKPVSWARELLEELQKFPAGEHDDRVDCTTQALIYLKDSGFLELEVVDEEEEDYWEKPKTNPYAL